MFPLREDFVLRLVEADRIADVADPIHGNEVVMSILRFDIRARQPDLVLAFHVIDGSDMLAIRRQDFHVFRDIGGIGHVGLHSAV